MVEDKNFQVQVDCKALLEDMQAELILSYLLLVLIDSLVAELILWVG